VDFDFFRLETEVDQLLPFLKSGLERVGNPEEKVTLIEILILILIIRYQN